MIRRKIKSAKIKMGKLLKLKSENFGQKILLLLRFLRRGPILPDFLPFSCYLFTQTKQNYLANIKKK